MADSNERDDRSASSPPEPLNYEPADQTYRSRLDEGRHKDYASIVVGALLAIPNLVFGRMTPENTLGVVIGGVLMLWGLIGILRR